MSCVFLLPIKGVWNKDWAVSYQDHCALRGTSVTIPCSYSYPPRHPVPLVTWYRGDLQPNLVGKPLFTFPSLSKRLEYLGDTSNQCTLRINKLLHSDQAGYFIILEKNRERWTSSYIILTIQGRLHTACC